MLQWQRSLHQGLHLLLAMGVVVEVAMVVGTGAETITGTMQVLVQIDIIMAEIVRVHTEITSALSI